MSHSSDALLSILTPSEYQFYQSIAFIFYTKTYFLDNSCEAFSKSIIVVVIFNFTKNWLNKYYKITKSHCFFCK